MTYFFTSRRPALLAAALPSLLGSYLMFWSADSRAHGFVEYPKARQQICNEQGGYWWPADGSAINNSACRAAFLQSGGYLFTQFHEYSSNVSDYRDSNAVQAVVQNGLLCAGGDSRKSGMDIPSADWQKTVIDTHDDIIQLRFRANTPHNPSFWQFYLSNPDFDPSQKPLHWQDLSLWYEVGDVAVTAGYYHINIPMPKGRRGDAVLYTRWQRDDVVGEGFYNCSDISLIGDDNQPQWFDKGSYQPNSQPALGETVLLRVFDQQGQELLTQPFTITSDNQAQWPVLLAEQVNTSNQNWLRIGVVRNGHIAFDAVNLAANRLWLSNQQHFVNLDIKAATPTAVTASAQTKLTLQNGTANWPVTLTGDTAQTVKLQLQHGTTNSELNVAFTPPSQVQPFSLSATGDYQLTVTSGDGQQQTLLVSVSNTNGCGAIDGSTVNTYPEFPRTDWQGKPSYAVAGDYLRFNQQIYQAKWWTNSQPGSDDSWRWLCAE